MEQETQSQSNPRVHLTLDKSVLEACEANTLKDSVPTIEGGDVVQFNNLFFIGISARTNHAGAILLRNAIQKSCPLAVVIFMYIKGTTYYHLDTCFLPSLKFCIVAEPIETLFSTETCKVICEFYDESIIVASHLTTDPWTLCNARSLYRTGNCAILFSCHVNTKIRDAIRTYDNSVVILGIDLNEISIGGGGLSCVSLGTSILGAPVFMTHPDQCNLHVFSLNQFQVSRQREYSSSSSHTRRLIKETTKIKDLYRRVGSNVVWLKSRRSVPECIFIKDLGVLVAQSSHKFVLILCHMSVAERREEVTWIIEQIENNLNNEVFYL
jgi:N-dimethylarginine dimethylaminohydrolase